MPTPRQHEHVDKPQKTTYEALSEGINNAYGSDCHANFAPCFGAGGREGHEVITDYDSLKLSTFRVLSSLKGSVFTNDILFIEQFIITGVFFLSCLPVWWMFYENSMDYGRDDVITVRKWLKIQEPRMRDFAMIMMALCALLLTFYTGMAVGRWWTIRTQGVGGIKAAAVELEMYVGTLVTRDPTVLSAIRRYARTSLTLVFLWRRKQLPEMKQLLIERELLDEPEVDKLLEWNHNLHETIWAWQSAIITLLHKEGKIKSDRLLEMLLERCSHGRQAVQCIHTHLAVRVPMQYIHLLGYLVKMHNLVLAIIMGMLFGAAIQNGEKIIMLMTFGRTLLLPLLFNAVLLINAELSDPFKGGVGDFPGSAYEKALEKDGQAFIAASETLPTWLQQRLDKSPMV